MRKKTYQVTNLLRLFNAIKAHIKIQADIAPTGHLASTEFSKLKLKSVISILIPAIQRWTRYRPPS